MTVPFRLEPRRRMADDRMAALADRLLQMGRSEPEVEQVLARLDAGEPAPSALATFGREVLQGLTGEFADELAGDDATTAYLRQQREAGRAAHPLTATAGNFAGALMLGGATAGIPVGPLAQAATVGGLTGAGMGEDAASRGLGAVGGAALGAGAARAAQFGLMAAGRGVARLTGQPVLGMADEVVARRMGLADPATRQAVTAEAARNPDLALMDIGGAPARRLARTAVNLSEGAQGVAEGFVRDRRTNAVPTLVKAVREASPPIARIPGGAAEKALKASKSAQMKPLYDAAYGDVLTSPEVRAAWDALQRHPIGQRVAAQAMEASRGAGQAAGAGAGPEGISVRTVDAAQRILRDMARRGFDQGGVGGFAGEISDDLVRPLLDAAQRESGKFALARTTNAILQGEVDAFKAGRQLAGSQDVDALAEAFAALPTTGQARQRFADGLASGLRARLSSTAEGRNVYQQLLGGAGKKLKAGIAFGDKAPQVTRAAEDELLKAESVRALTGNSTTAQQANDMAGLAAEMVGAPGEVLGPGTIAQKVSRFLLNRVASTPATAITRTLTETGAARDATLGRLVAGQGALDAVRQAGRQAAAPVGALAGSALARFLLGRPAP